MVVWSFKYRFLHSHPRIWTLNFRYSVIKQDSVVELFLSTPLKGLELSVNYSQLAKKNYEGGGRWRNALGDSFAYWYGSAYDFFPVSKVFISHRSFSCHYTEPGQEASYVSHRIRKLFKISGDVVNGDGISVFKLKECCSYHMVTVKEKGIVLSTVYSFVLMFWSWRRTILDVTVMSLLSIFNWTKQEC